MAMKVDSVKSESVWMLQLLQDNIEIKNKNWTSISYREWAGEVRQLVREGCCWTWGYRYWQ